MPTSRHALSTPSTKRNRKPRAEVMPKRTRDAAVATEEGGRALVALAALCAAPSVSGDYEEVPLEGGGFKRRRVGAKCWRYICEHGKEKTRCEGCGNGRKKCEHGRQRSGCKECGGG